MTVMVTGASDDLIEVRGDIDEEFDALGQAAQGAILGFSNGVVLRVTFDDDGVWRITPLHGASKVQITHTDDRTDVALISESVEWVVYGTAWAGWVDEK
ncbi:MAG: hypothetical protein ACOH10_15320 [Rhodoglobus sp.]